MCPKESLPGWLLIAGITCVSFKTRKAFSIMVLSKALCVFLKPVLQARLDASHYVTALVLVSSFLFPRSRTRLVSSEVW